MKHLWLLVLSLFALTLFIGCIQTVPVLYPQGTGEVWLTEEYSAQPSDDSLHVSIEFQALDQDRWVFLLRVKNATMTPIMINPENFYYVHEPTRANDGGNVVRAFVPEKELKKIESHKKKLTKTHHNRQGLNATATLIDLVADVATASKKKTKEEQDSEKIRDLERKVSYYEEKERYEVKIKKLDEEYLLWSEKAFTQVNLEPGGELEGLIYFPAKPEAGPFEICLNTPPYIFKKKYLQLMQPISK